MKEWNSRLYNFEFSNPREPIRTFRSRKPSHFIFEIQSYSELEKSLKNANLKAFETPEFKVGTDGDTWTLCIYPNGNEPRGGKGCLSLYLKRQKVGLGRSNSATVSLKFFILDQISGEYLVIEDLGEKNLDARAKECGLPNALKINEFTDEKNGFIVDNTCTFGVEVSVTSGEPKYTKLNIVKTIARSSFDVSFNLLAASSSPDQSLESSQFVSSFDGESYTWKLKIYLTGFKEGTDSHISLFLVLVDKDKVSNGRSILANFELSLMNKLTVQYMNANSKQDWFTETKDSAGFPLFISRMDFATNNAFSLGSSLNARVVFKDVFLLGDS